MYVPLRRGVCTMMHWYLDTHTHTHAHTQQLIREIILQQSGESSQFTVDIVPTCPNRFVI